MKNIIVYTRHVRPQNLYPKRIISPPAPNKCCASRMEVLGRPRVDPQGRRFCYKRCRVCGFALRYFLEPVPSVFVSPTGEAKARKPAPVKAASPIHLPARRTRPAPRKPARSRHIRRKPPGRRPHARATRRSAARRRR